MLKAATTATRAPRGTKPVSQAFFAALDSIPEASRTAVGKAAQVMIRDELKARRDKIKAAAAKDKARKVAATPAPKAAAKAVTKTSKKTEVKANGTVAPAKRRSRKPVDAPVTA